MLKLSPVPFIVNVGARAIKLKPMPPGRPTRVRSFCRPNKKGSVRIDKRVHRRHWTVYVCMYVSHRQGCSIMPQADTINANVHSYDWWYLFLLYQARLFELSSFARSLPCLDALLSGHPVGAQCIGSEHNRSQFLRCFLCAGAGLKSFDFNCTVVGCVLNSSGFLSFAVPAVGLSGIGMSLHCYISTGRKF